MLMDSYKDLTYYMEKHFENALNIGWEKDHEPWDYDREFSDLLGRYLNHIVSAIRAPGETEKVVFEGKEYVVGYGEFRVLGPGGTVYACPDILIPRVFAGQYKFPDCFEKAVREGPDPDGPEYREFMERYDMDHFWGASDDYLERMKSIRKLILESDPETVRGAVLKDPDILSFMTDQGSVLALAIKNGKEETALMLADQDIPFEMFGGRELLYAMENNMETVAEKLLDRNLPMSAERIGTNPLFTAIMKKMNGIAEKLFTEHKELIKTYNDIFVGPCNLLQWVRRCGNNEILQFIMNQYQTF